MRPLKDVISVVNSSLSSEESITADNAESQSALNAQPTKIMFLDTGIRKSECAEIAYFKRPRGTNKMIDLRNLTLQKATHLFENKQVKIV